MKYSIVPPIIGGIILGTALFFMPFFVLRIAVVALIIGSFIRLFAGRRYGRGFGRHRMFPAFADKIRNMSDEEYSQFKEKAQYGCRPFHQDQDKRNETH